MRLISIIVGMMIAAAGGTLAKAEDTIAFGDCKLTGVAGSIDFKPVKEDTLTVSAVLPSPGWWNGSTPDNIKSGFEYCLAAQIAYRAGVHHLEVRNMAWDQFISGAMTGYDIAMAGVTITEKRKAAMNFSSPYFTSNLGVAVRANSDVTAENIRQKRIGVLQGNMGADWVVNVLKPEIQPSAFQGQSEMFTALLANQVDVVITDTTLVLTGTSSSNGMLVVPAQYKLDQSYGIVLPKDSPNKDAVDTAIKDVADNGTLAQLTTDYLAPMFGGNPDSIPFWEIK